MGLSSFELGLVGAFNPAGYAVACILCALLLARVPVKRVLISGALLAVGVHCWIATSRSGTGLIYGHLLFGIASAGVWPFCSAWMLDLESPAISKPKILRYYNVAWTAGTATGMLSGGMICDRGLIFETFYFSAGVALSVAIVAVFTAPTRHRESSALEAGPESAPVHPADRKRVSIAELIAAMLFNLAAIGTKLLVFVNYVELNEVNGGGAGRMGIFLAAGQLSQLAAFGLGRFYEPHLGTRRLYALGAALMVGVCAAFALSSQMWILIPAVGAAGFVLAMAFQTAMFAFTARASSPRKGTVMVEALIGFAGLAPLAAGFLTDRMKAAGAPLVDALRAPFYAAMALIVLGLLVQMACARNKARAKRSS